MRRVVAQIIRLNPANDRQPIHHRRLPRQVEQELWRIFQEALAGKGVQVIARTLNEEGVPVFGAAKHWHRAYIVKLLDNPAVIGTLRPHILTHDEETGKQQRIPQDEVVGYYPAVVDTHVYQQVHDMRIGTPHPLRGKAASKETKNLFGGLGRELRRS